MIAMMEVDNAGGEITILDDTSTSTSSSSRSSSTVPHFEQALSMLFIKKCEEILHNYLHILLQLPQRIDQLLKVLRLLKPYKYIGII